MLKWSKGGIDQDGVWAKYWYSSVHSSEGFKIACKEAEIKLSEEFDLLLKDANFYYEALKKI